MTDFMVLAAISLLFVMGTSMFFYLSNKTNDVGYQIVTGVVDGVAISVHQRMFMLYNYWVPYVGSVASCSGVLGFAQLQFAGRAGDEQRQDSRIRGGLVWRCWCDWMVGPRCLGFRPLPIRPVPRLTRRTATLAALLRDQVLSGRRAGLDAVAGCASGFKDGVEEANTMSELATIALILGLFLLALAVGTFLCRVMYKRCDDILSGVVNGVPIPMTSRWLFFIQDYVGVSSGVTIVGGVSAFGFVAMAEAASDSSAQSLAYVCAS